MQEQTKYHIETVNGCAFRMRYLEGGVFEMGSNEKGESPIHQVELSPFYIAEYPVTQALWKAVMGNNNNPSQFTGDNRPVESISWMGVVRGKSSDFMPGFFEKLNLLTVETRPKDYVYRLPTNAEWEYAAKGLRPYKHAGSDKLKEVGWFDKDSHNETKAVGLKKPNCFELYDMSGNVCEWCLDQISESFYQECEIKGIVKDPFCNNGDTNYRIFRGGSWDDNPQSSEVVYLNGWPSLYYGNNVGFRLALAKVHTNI